MAKEKEITKDLIAVIKQGDKLVRDVENDIKEVMLAVVAVKTTITAIRNKFGLKDDR